MEEEPSFYASLENVRNPGMAPVDIPNVQFFYRCLEQVVELEIQVLTAPGYENSRKEYDAHVNLATEED